MWLDCRLRQRAGAFQKFLGMSIRCSHRTIYWLERDRVIIRDKALGKRVDQPIFASARFGQRKNARISVVMLKSEGGVAVEWFPDVVIQLRLRTERRGWGGKFRFVQYTEVSAPPDMGRKSRLHLLRWSTYDKMNHSVLSENLKQRVAKVRECYVHEVYHLQWGVRILWDQTPLCSTVLQSVHSTTICSIGISSTLTAQRNLIPKLAIVVSKMERNGEFLAWERVGCRIWWPLFRVFTNALYTDDIK